MQTAVKLTRHYPLSQLSPFSQLLSSKGSTAWEHSVKTKVEAVVDDWAWMGGKPKEPEPSFPCCLCISSENDGLLRVHDPPAWWYDPTNAAAGPCMAHEDCALIVPETWVDEVEANLEEPDGQRKERVVFGVDGIVKDRWNLVSLSYSICLQYSPFSVEMCGLRNT